MARGYVNTGMGDCFSAPLVFLISFAACVSRLKPLSALLFLSPDFHESWPRMMSICLFTEVNWQWATLVLR